MPWQRRDKRMQTLLAATAAAVALSLPAQGHALPVTLTVDLSQPAGSPIEPSVYGQFSEMFGRGIYEGLWVGEESSIPNFRGFRQDVVQALRQLRVPVLRWPGGCFADTYHWRDGIGPRDKRP